MAKYKYNDVILPALPEWDKEAYPFAVITDDNCLHVHEFPIVVNYSSELGTTPFVTCVEGISNGYYYTYNAADDAWEAPVSKKFGKEDDGIHCVSSVLPIWSNHVVFNVFNGLNTVYLTGSEPVSVEDEDTGGDTEGGENEGDDTTGGENTDGAEPETPTDTTPVPAEFYVKHGGKVYKVSGDTTELTQRVEALEQDAEDLNQEVQTLEGRVDVLEQGGTAGTGVNIIVADSEKNLPADAEDGTIAIVECAESEEEESGGESGGSTADATLQAAKTYTDDQITKYWTEAPVFDFTSVFNFVQSVAKGGTLETATYDNGSVFVARAKNEPVKIKVAFNQQQACMNVLPQYFHNEIDGVDDSYCQFTDFVVLGGCLLYMYMTVSVTGHVSYQCQQVTTTPYNPS